METRPTKTSMAATHKTLLILANALLEWILILMLLLNSFFSYLIRKYATHYRLKPPCVYCSTIDHILDPNNNVNYTDLICKPHATEIFNLYCSSDPLTKETSTELLCRNGRCSCCFDQVDSTSASTFKLVYGKNEVVQVMDFPVENKSSGHIQVFDQIIPLEWTDSSTSCSTTSAGSNGHESMVFVEQDQVQKQDGRFLESSDCQDEEDKAGLSIDSLMAELKAKRLVVGGLYIELDEERNASSAIAANKAMATITRLEEEKVALQIEYKHNQRMMDEQAEYDQEVVQLLNELVMKLENEKVELENEVEMYKEKLLDSCSSSKESSLDDETDVLDLKNLRAVKESIWIMDELKDVIRKASLDGEDEDLGYKGINRVFHLFDHVEGMEMNEEDDDEASHSAWRQTSFSHSSYK